MALLKIARLGNPVLRLKAEPVAQGDIASREVQTLIDDMTDTMREADGVGLAAPQVHVPRRIILIEVNDVNPRYPGRPSVPLTALINPEITPLDETQERGWEGCLSIPDLRGRVPRYTRIRVSARDRQGAPINLDAEGFFARVIQHEVDHLDGIVFPDRMKDLSSLTHLREFQRFWMEPTA